MNVSFRFMIAMILIAILASSISTYYVVNILSGKVDHQQNKMSDQIFVIFERFDGSSTFETPNIITDLGENHTRNQMCRAGTIQNITKLAVGNHSTVAAGDTVLDSVFNDGVDGQYPEATIIEWLYSGDAAFNATFKWTFDTDVTINSTATYSFNTTFAYSIANFASDESFSDGENLTVLWIHAYNGN